MSDTRYRDAAVTFAGLLLTFYAVGAFIGLEPNPLRWSEEGRVYYAVGGVFLALWLAVGHIALRDPRP